MVSEDSFDGLFLRGMTCSKSQHRNPFRLKHGDSIHSLLPAILTLRNHVRDPVCQASHMAPL